MTADICANCGQTESKLGIKMKVCGRCKSSAFCSKECQTEGWKRYHKADCNNTVEGRNRTKAILAEYTCLTGTKLSKEDDPTHMMNDFGRWAAGVRYLSCSFCRDLTMIIAKGPRDFPSTRALWPPASRNASKSTAHDTLCSFYNYHPEASSSSL